MDIRGEFEKDFLKRPYMGSIEEDCIWSAKWAMERCAWFVARELKHPFIQHPERAYLAEAIRQLAKEME